MAFWSKEKEIKSDLYYKVTASDDATFSYQRNNRKIKNNVKKLKLSPGDWVTISSTKHLDYEERKFLNWVHIFYIKKRSLFNLLFQLILLASYVVAYSFAIIEFNGFEDVTFHIDTLMKDVILFAPIVLLMFKAAKTFTKAITLGGPNRTLKNKFTMFESIIIKDKKKQKRTITFNSDGEMIEDEHGKYFYGDAEKINSNIYKFGLLIFNKNEEPLYNVEYYTIQVDFKQLEGILIPNSKKLEHSNVHLNLHRPTK